MDLHAHSLLCSPSVTSTSLLFHFIITHFSPLYSCRNSKLPPCPHCTPSPCLLHARLFIHYLKQEIGFSFCVCVCVYYTFKLKKMNLINNFVYQAPIYYYSTESLWSWYSTCAHIRTNLVVSFIINIVLLIIDPSSCWSLILFYQSINEKGPGKNNILWLEIHEVQAGINWRGRN